MQPNTHYMLVDGANIDGVLGQILGHQPWGSDRPRWDAVMKFSKGAFQPDGRRAVFFIAADDIQSIAKIAPFLTMLRANKFKPVLLRRETNRQVVDEAIIKLLGRLIDHQDKPNILLLSHDSDFVDTLKDLRERDPERSIAVLGFPECLAAEFDDVQNLQIFDIEDDVQGGFNYQLPRDRLVVIDEWDPDYLLLDTAWSPADEDRNRVVASFSPSISR